METIDKIKLLKFIAKAHRNTYAAPKEVGKKYKLKTPFLPGHECYYFSEGEWEYYDGYAGDAWAPGREVVLFKGEPIWTMSYQGKHNSKYPDDFIHNEVFVFLRKALMNFKDEMPFRGPIEFEEGDFRYVFKINGDYQYFTGREAIYYKGIKVFFQDVMGEIIK